MTDSVPGNDPLSRLCSLGDPTRRRLYDFVARQTDPVSRDAAARALGLDRATAAYHLDRLVDQRLLVASFARPEGRGGPGAGRPAKHYARAAEELSVGMPPRDYRLAAILLADAAERDETGQVRRALGESAAAKGAELVDAAADANGGPVSDLHALLEALGFEPYTDGEVVRLRNCPFHLLAREHTDLICGMNLEMLAAAAARVDPGVEAMLEPDPSRCCVVFRPRQGESAE